VACLEADFVLSLPTHQGTYYTFGIICMLALFIVWLPNVLNFLPCLKSKLL
jgi:hypothetical protein